MSQIRDRIKKILTSRYFPLIFFSLWFFFFLILSIFRDARLDENIYIGDSVQIANLLEEGRWIGNYGIGLHGFLNKLLIGIIFVFTGPSVFIATLSNIVVAILSGFLFFKILEKNFKFSRVYSLLGVSLLFSSYQFITYTPSFYRDILALFGLLFVVYIILNKKNNWLLGLSLLLLLDAKEHVFFTVAPAILLWIFVTSFLNNKKKKLESLRRFILNNIKIFLPSLIFLILMFSTSLIPLNIYNANILGLIEGGLKPMYSNFDIDMATYNRDSAVNIDTARVMPTLEIPNDASIILSFFIYVINIIISYIGKILYPRTFSFLSIPFVVLIPSLWMAYRSFILYFREKEKEKLVLPILIFVYLAIYVLHASISRYIIPISPIIFVYFLLFLQNVSYRRFFTKKVFIFTLIFIIAGLYFEYSYVLIKVFINISLLFIIYLLYFSKRINKLFLKSVLILIISMFSLGTSLLASYMYGQIKGYRLYGYSRECQEIVSSVDNKDRIWINDIFWDRLPFILREENLGDPEWRWSLKEWIPKKKLLIKNNELKTYNFYWKEISEFEEKLIQEKIDKVLYIKTQIKHSKENIVMQDRLEILMSSEVLLLEDRIPMKNKEVFIFKVIKE